MKNKTKIIKALILVGATLLVLNVITPNVVMAQEEFVTLASYETRYGDYGRYRGRAHNIRRSAELVSGFIISPGERFSFNQAVGRRTHSRSFRMAPVIASGRMELDIGGGVCQVATTIYAAALFAGLTIIEQHPHSHIVSYVQAGLDATVDWGTKDLIIENPFLFPVTILVRTYRGEQPAEERVIVKIIAPERVYEVLITRIQRHLADFNTIVEVDETLEPEQRHVIEPGAPRIWVVLRQTLVPINEQYENRAERREALYEASDRIVRVGVAEQKE